MTHYDLEHEGEEYAVDIEEEIRPDSSERILRAKVGGRSFRIAIGKPVSGDVLRADVDDRPVSVTVEKETRYSIDISIDGESVTFVKAGRGAGLSLKKEEEEGGGLSPRSSGAGSDSTEGRRLLRSSLPGRVVSVKVTPGEQVHTGSPLLVVVAMKMESTISSDREGAVVEVLVKEGDAIRRGQPLVRF